ncbi:uncharacterized protein B0H18DRAFT_882148, partial [Fomitopsis serialis]|uniref:uncharacterized protein n=1 Tax=Fomitopsis serialis TaxID=139415 RepID=UPI0020079B0F
QVGAQVMLIKNLVQGQLVNGSLGRVVAFSTPRDARKCGTDIAKEAPNGAEKQKPDQHTLQVAENYIWPIVEFRNGHTLLCIPATFEAINADGRVEATRHQVRSDILADGTYSLSMQMFHRYPSYWHGH